MSHLQCDFHLLRCFEKVCDWFLLIGPLASETQCVVYASGHSCMPRNNVVIVLHVACFGLAQVEWSCLVD